jgi:hypothetical protein
MKIGVHGIPDISNNCDTILQGIGSKVHIAFFHALKIHLSIYPKCAWTVQSYQEKGSAGTPCGELV